MAYNLVLNTNNSITNNTYQYQFINGSLQILDEAEICISNLQIPYSWFNVTKAYNNQTFQIKFPTSSSSGQTYTITLNEGFFTVTDINAYIQQFCITNGLYLINSLGQYVYYLVLLYNVNTYGVQLITTLVPTSLPSGFSAPANWVGYNATSYCPQLIISSTNTFGKIIGYTAGTYPSVNTASASTLNSVIPLGSNVNSLIVRCSLVDNQVGVPTDILDTINIPTGATFGSNINYTPPALKWLKMTGGIQQFLRIVFVDQNFNALAAQDTNVCISLLINNKGKPVETKLIEKLEKLNIRI